MHDPTEAKRRKLFDAFQSDPKERPELEKIVGQVWDTDELQKDFAVQSFLAPFVIVRRRSDGKVGTLLFQPRPRYYFGFELDKE